MKQSLQFLSAGLFILMSSLFLPAYSQDYPKVIEEGQTWIYVDSASVGDWPVSGYPSYYSFEGEVEVNGKTYHKFYSRRHPFTQGVEDVYDCVALMREEDGKVYLYTPEEVCPAPFGLWRYGAMDHETVIYDFTIPVGGSYVTEATDFSFRSPYEVLTDICTVTLNSITTKEIDGKILRCYNYTTETKSHNNSYNGSERIYTNEFSFTESIGPDSGNLSNPDNGLFLIIPTNGSGPEYPIAVYDNENENLIYDWWGADPEIGPGSDFRNVLSEGLDFEYVKYAVPVSGEDEGIKRGNMPMGSAVHYRVSGQRNVYGNTFYQIWRYEGEYNSGKEDLIAFMREERGRLIMHYW